MTDGPVVDLDVTEACPLDEQCENCGTPEDLAVATAATAVGIHCLTLCGACADAGTVPEPRRLVPRRRSRSGALPAPRSTPTRWRFIWSWERTMRVQWKTAGEVSGLRTSERGYISPPCAAS